MDGLVPGHQGRNLPVPLGHRQLIIPLHLREVGTTARGFRSTDAVTKQTISTEGSVLGGIVYVAVKFYIRVSFRSSVRFGIGWYRCSFDTILIRISLFTNGSMDILLAFAPSPILSPYYLMAKIHCRIRFAIIDDLRFRTTSRRSCFNDDPSS